MSDFSKTRAIFDPNSSKDDKNKINDKPAQPGKLSGDRWKFLENINKKTKQKESKNIKPAKPITINSNKDKFNERINQFNQPKNSNNNIEKKEFIDSEIKLNVKDIIKAINDIKPKEKPKQFIKEVPKILEDSYKISNNENPELITYHYPNKPFPQFIANYKILLFLGNNNEQYINAFINIYRDICYEDNERYVVKTDNSKHNYKIYYIKARTSKHHLIIISLPFSYKNGQFIKDIFNIFEIENIPKKINYICVPLEENNHLDEKGITIILSIFNLFEKKDKKYNIIFLFSKEKDDNIINETNKNIVFSGYINDYLSSIFNSHYFCINHKILYEKSETNKNQWNELDKAIKTIQNMIKSSTDLNLDKNKEFLFIDIFSDEKNKNYRLQKHFNSLEKKEQIILINYLILCDIPDLTSSSILFLYNKILENEKEITVNEFEIILSKSDNLNDKLYILSKVKFNKLKNLVGQECNLIDIDLNLIKNLFSQNLLQLDLSNNELKDISIFTKEEEFLVNLNNLDLSHNRIVNISNLFNCKFLFLKDLNLSHNEISDINCLQQNLYFNSLQKLDLSYNRIKILNKIDIKTLNYLDLNNNEISEGFIDFLKNFCNSCFSCME